MDSKPENNLNEHLIEKCGETNEETQEYGDTCETVLTCWEMFYLYVAIFTCIESAIHLIYVLISQNNSDVIIFHLFKTLFNVWVFWFCANPNYKMTINV
jgi:hypothetical protein